jgi:hypothetical protein
MLIHWIAQHKRDQAITDEHIDHWLNAYGLRQKLRFAPSERDSIGSPEVQSLSKSILFHN